METIIKHLLFYSLIFLFSFSNSYALKLRTKPKRELTPEQKAADQRHKDYLATPEGQAEVKAEKECIKKGGHYFGYENSKEKECICLDVQLPINDKLPICSKHISKALCKNTSYQDRFPPVKDQGGLGICWAYAATALLEEDRCLKDPSKCGKALSDFDTSRCLRGIDEGSNIRRGLDCGMNEGVCEEDKIPLNVNVSAECLRKDYIYNLARKKGENAEDDDLCADFVRSIYNVVTGYYRSNNRACFKSINTKSPTLEGFIEDNKQILETISADFSMDNREKFAEGFYYFATQYPDISKRDPNLIFDAMDNTSDHNEFIYSYLIPNQCKQERSKISSEKKIVAEEGLPPNNSAKNILEGLSANRSVGIEVCVNNLIKDLDSENYLVSNDSCGGHAIVVNGMKRPIAVSFT